MKENKTNAMRIMENAGFKYEVHSFKVEPDNYVPLSEENAVEKTGREAARVFKTIVVAGKSGEHYVFMAPVCRELDLKKCAAAVSEKSVSPLHLKDLLPTTGYVRGGCSPLGMKKKFRTVADETAILYDTIVFSAGRPGLMMEAEPSALAAAADVEFKDITFPER